MKRYHKKVYFPIEDSLQVFTDSLNNKQWLYSKHCIDNIKYRVSNMQGLLLFIKDLKLDYNNIFEYYQSQDIEKACFRIAYKKDIDIILVVSKDKNIITIYVNSKDDLHFTLRKEMYQKEV